MVMKIEGLKIEIKGNSVQFTTPSGETYFKNRENFLKALEEKNKFFMAPRSQNKAEA